MKDSATTVDTVLTHSAAETREWGVNLAPRLRAGDVVALRGDLGAGKTCLAKGIAEGLGVTITVTSPTFTIIHEYAGRLPVFHIDLYRLGSTREAIDIGVQEYFGGEGICIVEWAEKIPHLLPVGTWHIEIEILGEQERRLTVSRQHQPVP